MEIILKAQAWLKDKLKSKKTVLLILGLIVVSGAFLRAYHHKEWLYFDDDQANDAIVVSNAVTGKTGWPLLGPNMGNTQFRLGPIFYDFEIISAKLFGNYPDKLAYPDLFFSILTLPLFYYFLRKYFSANISLALTGLWTFSYFAIKFSRFAWNTNSMPLFILLFLLGLGEFLFRREKTSWWWVLALGVALGVGVQLHAMLLVMFPLFCLGALALTARSGKGMWLRWGSVLLIALLLNTGQIIHEFKYNFSNTKAFFQNADDRSGSGADKFLPTVAFDAACHVQFDTFEPSTLGDKDNCDFLKSVSGGTGVALNWKTGWQLALMALALAFAVFGYAALARSFRDEKDAEKKIFLGLAAVYVILFFIIMFPSIKAAPLRYFLPSFFVPYLFLGFLIRFWQEKYPRGYFPAVTLLLSVLLILNVTYLATIVAQLEAKDRSGASDAILGELESMRAYIIATAAPQKKAYLFGSGDYIYRFYRPLQYLAAKDGFAIEQGRRVLEDDPSILKFYIYKSYPAGESIKTVKGMKVITAKNFGQIAVYEVIKTPGSF